MSRILKTLQSTPAALHYADPDALREGARNLLLNCAGLTAGQRVVILAEDPALGWYDADAPRVTAELAREVGGNVTLVSVAGPDVSPGAAIQTLCQSADLRIFFARIGDQARFCERPERGHCVMVYARTAEALASDFGTRAHGEMVRLRDKANAALFTAKTLRLTCPLGTDVTGTPPVPASAQAQDVTVLRFPMCMPAPMPARTFTGQVALAGYLTPTGSRSYRPATLALSSVVMAQIEGGRITGFKGPSREVEAIRRHYHNVSDQFGIDPDIVHSWHAGIHPGCTFAGNIHDDPDLWSNSIFGSPQYLHFHTCGAYAPGEICWMVANPTITADGTALWHNGHLQLR